jgi:hypothetical protein
MDSRAFIDRLEPSDNLMGTLAVSNLDLYLAGSTPNQQRQAGDSLAVQRSVERSVGVILIGKPLARQEVCSWRDVRRMQMLEL